MRLDRTVKRQSTGRGTAVIHRDFTDALRTRAESTHTGKCAIRHPGGTVGPINPTTGKKDVVPFPSHFTGSCLIERLPASETVPVSGDEQVPTVTYTVAVGAAAASDTHTGDLVTVTEVGDNGDVTFVGKVLIVDSIDRDTITAERVFRCSENQS